MKSPRIIYILFFLFCIIPSAGLYAIGTGPQYKGVQVDSLFFKNKALEVNKEHAKSVIDWHQKALNQDMEFSNEDLENIAVSYAYLDKAPESKEYLLKYIKSAHSVDIINNEAFENINDSEEYQSVVKKYKPELNPWLIFFFSAGLIGIFIALVLNLRKKSDAIANTLISLFVLFHSFFMIHLCLFLSNYHYKFPNSLYITSSFSFLYGPLLYFYFKRISEKYSFKYIDLLHLIPTVALFVYLIPFYILPPEEKLHLLYNGNNISHSRLITVVILKCISLMAYAYFIYRIYRKNASDKNEIKRHVDILKWEKNIMLLNIIYVGSYVIYGIAIMNKVTTNILIYPQILVMSVIVLYVAYTAYVQPKIFSEKYLFNNLSLKYKKSGLTESYSNELKELLLQLFYHEKVYKESDISLDILSEKLGTTRHSLSQVINEHFDMNFFNLINKFRIEEALRIFESDPNNNLNIIDVAYDVGFNNKVTFNKAFKEQTSLTPSEYLKYLKHQQINKLKVNLR